MKPVYLPEFDCLVSWAMCRNPSCQNFGIHYEGTTATGNKLFRHQYDTPYGTIEFTHTKRNIPDENDGTVDVGRPFIEACYIGDIPSGLFMRTLAVAIGDTEFRSLEV